MKKFISGLLTGIIASLSLTAFAASLNIIPNPYPVLINGAMATVEGYNINGFTFLKLADFKKAGLTVKFNETDKQIEVTAPTVTASTAAPDQTINNTEVQTMSTDTIQYESDGFPIGGEYTTYELKGHEIKAIKFNGKIFLPMSELNKTLGLKSDIINFKDGSARLSIEDKSKDYIRQKGVNYLFVSNISYHELSLVEELLGD